MLCVRYSVRGSDSSSAVDVGRLGQSALQDGLDGLGGQHHKPPGYRFLLPIEA